MFEAEKIRRMNELELEVYHYVIQHKSAVPYMGIRELATEAHVSTTTVMHFCQKLDCAGYSEFKQQMKQLVGIVPEMDVYDDSEELKECLVRMQQEEMQAQIRTVADAVSRADQVICMGIGNSGFIAQYGARYFSNMGKFSTAIADPFYPIRLDRTSSIAVLILSVSGQSRDVISKLPYLQQENVTLITICSTENNPLVKLSDYHLCYHLTFRRKSQKSMDFTSQIPAVYLLESIARHMNTRLTEKN